MEPKKLGDLNGRWSILFRVLMVVGTIATVLSPFVIRWGVWVTSSVYELQAFAHTGDRFTAADGERLRSDLQGEIQLLADIIDNRIDDLPPTIWKDKIDTQAQSLDTIKSNQIKLMIQIDTLTAAVHKLDNGA